jgi:hypothetical protein
MKLLEKSQYNNLDVAEAFNKIILSYLSNYDGNKKAQLKSFFDDLQHGGCMSGMIGEFIYHADCKKFYIDNIDELEGMKSDLEDNYGDPIKNHHDLPHYTFLCWLCFEEYCCDLFNQIFED